MVQPDALHYINHNSFVKKQHKRNSCLAEYSSFVSQNWDNVAERNSNLPYPILVEASPSKMSKLGVGGFGGERFEMTEPEVHEKV